RQKRAVFIILLAFKMSIICTPKKLPSNFLVLCAGWAGCGFLLWGVSGRRIMFVPFGIATANGGLSGRRGRQEENIRGRSMSRRQQDSSQGIGEEAAETPNALSPIVGISREEVLSAIGSIVGGAVRQPFTFMQHVGSFGRNIVDIVGGEM